MRTYAKNRFERCVQILRWLKEEFEVAEDGALRFEWQEDKPLVPDPATGREQVYGMVIERGKKCVLILSAFACATRAQAIESLIHEVAHVRLWDTGRGLAHGPEFWKIFGEMMDAYDHHGCEDSKSYYVE